MVAGKSSLCPVSGFSRSFEFYKTVFFLVLSCMKGARTCYEALNNQLAFRDLLASLHAI